MIEQQRPLVSKIEQYIPYNEQEATDKAIILDKLRTEPNIFSRENVHAHMTASAWIVNPARTKTVMAYHKIYDSWAWLGGHADGEEDLLKVALKEVREESGLINIHPVTEDIFSLEILTVDGHEKKGKYVSSHLHLNVTYLIEADETEQTSVKEDENSGVSWFSFEDALKASTEKWFVDRVYSKLIRKCQRLYCDLHCHSNYSDGTCSPAQLVEQACAAQLGAIALTDHNTLDGIEEFLQAAKGRIEACPGCEFTTEDDGQELHLVGLFREDTDLDAIQNAIEEQRIRKEESNRSTIERLAEAGYDLSYEEFISHTGTGVKNRVHIARYLMEKGILSSVNEAFSSLLSPSEGYYQEVKKLDFCSMIKLVSEAGGISIWAHPLFHVDRETCERILQKAKSCGLDGVEVYYSTYTDDDTAFMQEMSRKYNLLQSGGSDFHGDNKPDIYIGTGYGNLRIPMELYWKMKEKMKDNRHA